VGRGGLPTRDSGFVSLRWWKWREPGISGVASGPAASPASQLGEPQEPLHLAVPGVLLGLNACTGGTWGLMPPKSHRGQEAPGVPLVSISSVRSSF